MSLNELNEFLGSIGASVRTGPIHGSSSRSGSNSGSSSRSRARACSCPRPCGVHRQRQQQGAPRCIHCAMHSCNCSQNPIVARMHTINQELPTMRERKLFDLLRLQNGLLGLIISRSTGKCIGAINNRGAITHCDARAAKGPYNIMIKPTSQDRIPHSCPPAARPIGQCVDTKGQTVAEITRNKGRNSLNLANKSKAPVIAIVLPMVTPKQVQGGSATAIPNIDDMIRESKSLVLNK